MKEFGEELSAFNSLCTQALQAHTGGGHYKVSALKSTHPARQCESGLGCVAFSLCPVGDGVGC